MKSVKVVFFLRDETFYFLDYGLFLVNYVLTLSVFLEKSLDLYIDIQVILLIIWLGINFEKIAANITPFNPFT